MYSARWRQLFLSTFLASTAMGVAANPAFAHGPNRQALDVHEGPPGTEVQVDLEYRRLEVIINPDPNFLRSDLINHPHGKLYKPSLPTEQLLLYRAPGPKRFAIPRMPPGRYIILIYDPSEGWPNAHYTWTTFRITGQDLAYTGSGDLIGPSLLSLSLLLAGSALLRRTRASNPRMGVRASATLAARG